MTDDDPVALDREVERLLNARDLDGRVTLYEPEPALMPMPGGAIEIARRQNDGRWLFAMDMPYGTPAP